MASRKLTEASKPPEEDLKVDMSPMIDLVFLLLIFFMVNSTLILTRIDKEVKIPVAKEAEVAKTGEGRIVVNIRANGDMLNVDLQPLEDEDAVARYVREIKALHDANGIKSRLYVRADREVEVKQIKKAVTGAGAAGVIDVIFSSYVTDK
ncbi:MAG: biopolymer transporter ExbD [Verrucomicrobiota bacterium]